MSFTLEVSVARAKFNTAPAKVVFHPPLTAAFHRNIELGAGLII